MITGIRPGINNNLVNCDLMIVTTPTPVFFSFINGRQKETAKHKKLQGDVEAYPCKTSVSWDAVRWGGG